MRTGGMDIQAPSHWRCADFISDLHLQSSDPKTFGVWAAYMQATHADALFILGDLFEVWVGDDALQPGTFEADCVDVLRQTGSRLALFLMHGNRDFLMGPDLMAACHATALPDPTAVQFGPERWLLSHGDALCLGDHSYQAFRTQVRSAEWQQEFLAKPLTERQTVARGIRQASESRKHSDAHYADVDTPAALQVLESRGCQHLLHGHTHRPALHALDATHKRFVLSDWDANGAHARAEVLRLRWDDQAVRTERLSVLRPAMPPV